MDRENFPLDKLYPKLSEDIDNLLSLIRLNEWEEAQRIVETYRYAPDAMKYIREVMSGAFEGEVMDLNGADYRHDSSKFNEIIDKLNIRF